MICLADHSSPDENLGGRILSVYAPWSIHGDANSLDYKLRYYRLFSLTLVDLSPLAGHLPSPMPHWTCYILYFLDTHLMDFALLKPKDHL